MPSSFTLQDWLAIASIILALFSIGFGIFSICQANASANRAEDLNTKTQVALKEISDYARNIESLVKDLQAQQMSVIAKSQDKLIDVVASAANANANANIENLIDKKLSGMSADENYY